MLYDARNGAKFPSICVIGYIAAQAPASPYGDKAAIKGSLVSAIVYHYNIRGSIEPMLKIRKVAAQTIDRTKSYVEVPTVVRPLIAIDFFTSNPRSLILSFKTSPFTDSDSRRSRH